jgi:hypothetical protein
MGRLAQRRPPVGHTRVVLEGFSQEFLGSYAIGLEKPGTNLGYQSRYQSGTGGDAEEGVGIDTYHRSKGTTGRGRAPTCLAMVNGSIDA